MRSAYGARLFRLFLLLALVPAIVMAAIGLYLSAELADSAHIQTGRGIETVVNLQRELISRSLSGWLESAPREADSSTVDFAFLIGKNGLETIRAHPALDSSLARVLTSSSDSTIITQTASGHVVHARYRKGDDGIVICAGYVLPPDFREALLGLQADQARITAASEYLSYYPVFLAVVLGLLIVLAGLVSWYLSRRWARALSEPIMALSTAAGEVAQGHFDRRVDVTAVGELALLVQSFNDMAQRLLHMTEELRQAERVAAWRGVARRFAHELKNPLQPITVSLYRLQKQMAAHGLPQEAAGALEAVSTEVDHLKALAERFSELSKLPPPQPEATDLATLLTSVADLYREQLADYRFRVEVPTGPLPAVLDPNYLREAVHNLLKNAREATEPGGQIALTVTVDKQTIVIRIMDSGRGMTVEELATARLPYYTTKSRGSGLGLAMVERIVTEAGGHLSIDSAPTEGTTVTISLRSETKS